MKALVVDPYGGNEAVLLQALDSGGVETVFVSLADRMRPGIPSSTKVFQAPENVRGPFEASKIRLLNPLRRAWLLARQSVYVRQRVAETRPDVILAIDLELGLPVALRAGNIPVIGNSEGSDMLVVPGRSDKQKGNLYRWLKRAHGVVLYTTRQESALRKFAGETLPTFKLGAWRDCAMFSPFANPPTRPLVLCLRGSRAVYRPEILVEACARAYRRTSFVLRLGAANDDIPRLLAVAHDHGLPKEAIEFVTSRIPYERMPLEYGAATVVAQAILDESLGYTGIETMACGRVMVQPDSEVAREVLSPNQQAFLSGPDAESLAEKLVLALTNHELRRNVEDANRHHALKYYDRAKVLPRVGAELQAWLASIVRNAR